MRCRPVDWRRCDIGYASLGIHVASFDATLARIDAVGGGLKTAPVGESGRRRVCLTDPDGMLIELMEDDPLGIGAARGDDRMEPAVASVTLSVRDLDVVRRFWIEVLRCDETEMVLHEPDHERLWGLAGARRRALVLLAGEVALEFVQYASPIGRARPAGYMLSDQGILNVAFGSTDKRAFDAMYNRALAHGFKGVAEPWSVPGVATVVYLTDSQGFSVELLHVEPHALSRMGFVPNETDSRRAERCGNDCS